jgi:hypothetical protein
MHLFTFMRSKNSINLIFFIFICAVTLLTIRVEAQTDTQIEVINFSFEEPDVGKIKGWDGGCADSAWTGATDDIPGWVSADTAWDSGVETDYGPTDGIYTAFLMARDTSVYQITEHFIQSGDQITLFVDAHITYLGNLLEMKLFYVDTSGSFVDLAYDYIDLISDMDEYSISFKASDYPASIGKKLGIWFDNITSESNSWLGLDNVRLINSGATDVKTTKLNPIVYSLSQNYPNPFNPQTTIKYSLPSAGLVTLKVYDLLGCEVTTLIQGKKEFAGNHFITFNAGSLPSGIYFYRLQADKFSETKKMLLIK